MAQRAVKALALVIFSAGCGAEPQTTPQRGPPPTYATREIYRFDFQGVRLGMARDDICPRILANGYRNRDGAGCGPTVPHREGESEPVDVFLGGAAPRPCGEGECPPGAPSANVTFLSLTYERIGGRDIVREINVDTAEPGPLGPKTESTIRQWGVPTFHEPGRDGGYSVLIWGATVDQADWGRRESYNRCQFSSDCEARRGTDCGAVISDYATATAAVTIYDWGRWIRIEDRRPQLRALRASGRLRGRSLAPGSGCMQTGTVEERPPIAGKLLARA